MRQIKIGVFTDTHGNLPALQAMLEALNDLGCDEIFNLGDVVGLGAYPAECVETVLNVPNIINIMGNHELLYLKGIDNLLTPIKNKEEELHHRHIHDLLDGRYKEELRNWVYQVDREWFGSKVTFLHYARKNNLFCGFPPNNKLTADYLDDVFDYVDADTVLFGHEHTPATIKSKHLYVDVGSLGCNRENLAKGALITVSQNGMEIDNIKVPYDKQKFFDEMERRQIARRDFILNNYFGMPTK